MVWITFIAVISSVIRVTRIKVLFLSPAHVLEHQDLRGDSIDM
jgi:hypothetical protein